MVRKQCWGDMGCGVLLQGRPQRGKSWPGSASHYTPLFHIASRAGDSTRGDMRVDAGVGRCLGIGTMQNMQELG